MRGLIPHCGTATLFTRLGGASCAARVALVLLLNSMSPRNRVKAGQWLAKAACLIAFSLISLSTARAQTTAFTYQGSLANDGVPANGSYDLTFTLFDTNSSGAPIAGPVTNSATTVSNGLFTTTIDFGTGVFNGTNYWLEIAVQTNGGGGFTTLAPRQQVTPTPYAIYSANAGNATSAASTTTAATANNFSGSLAGDVTGSQGSTVVASVGGQSAANVAGGAVAANAATSANTPNAIVQRDASGSFSAGTVTANLAGNAATATTATNMVGTFQSGVTVNAGLTSSNSYTLGNRAVTPLTNFPVAAMFPVNANSPMALDLMPSAGASDYFFNGVSWIDICSTNCLTNNPPLTTLRLQVSTGGTAYIGTELLDGATTGNLNIGANGLAYMLMTPASPGVSFAYNLTPSGNAIDIGYPAGGGGGSFRNLYLKGSIFLGTNNDNTTIKAVSPGTLQISTNLNVTGTISANSLNVSNTASIKTNTAAFGTVSQPITLGSTFTNLMAGRADFVGQFTFNLSATGNPILVISNLTTGLVITNEIPGVSGTAMQGIVFPDVSPNDICEAFDASSGSGASVSFVQGWWIVK